MHALWISTLVVAVAEIGDKTQLLSLVLAARYRRPWPIVAGIALATLLNHAAAALATRRYDSTELFGARNVILIRHAGQDYVLRVTRNGKLILTK